MAHLDQYKFDNTLNNGQKKKPAAFGSQKPDVQAKPKIQAEK